MVVAVPLSHAVWAEVAAFLDWNDRYSLLALSSDVVDSQLRRQFFSQSAWRIPPTSSLANRVVLHLSVKRSIRRVEISYTWQQAYLSSFPLIEHVVINAMDERDGEEEEEDDWDDERRIDFVLSSTIPATVKRLSVDWFDGVPSMAAIAHLVNLEELKLDVMGVSDESSLLPLAKLTRLSIGMSGYIEDEGYKFLSGLRHLRKLSIAVPYIRANAFPVLSPLEDVNFMYGTGVMSMDLLVGIAPQLKRLAFGSSLSVSTEDTIFFTITAELGAALTSIEELDLRDVHCGTSPEELAVLSRLTTLKKLLFPVEFRMQSLAPLAGLTQLEELEVGARPRADWSPLEGMKKLRYLCQWADASERNVSCMRTLANLPLLTTLLGPTKLIRQFPLPQVKTMELAPMRRNQVLAFVPGCCVNVTDLAVRGSVNIASLVQSFPNLQRLSIDGSLSGIRRHPSPLTSLPRLHSLELQSVGDLSLLRCMKDQLCELTLRSLPLQGCSVVHEFTRLRMLDLKRCTLGSTDSLTWLRGHPSLVVLRLPLTMHYRELVNEDGGCSLPSLRGIWQWGQRVY